MLGTKRTRADNGAWALAAEGNRDFTRRGGGNCVSVNLLLFPPKALRRGAGKKIASHLQPSQDLPQCAAVRREILPQQFHFKALQWLGARVCFPAHNQCT